MALIMHSQPYSMMNEKERISMLKFTVLFIISLLTLTNLFISAVSATEKTLATLSNDENKNTYLLIVDSDKDNQAIKTFYKDVYSNGKRITREVLDYNILINKGLILEQRDKYVILKLKSFNFDKEQGGIITIDTLYNGANGLRKSYDIQMAKTKTDWALINEGKIVNKIFIQTNKVMLLGSVGIKNLVMK